MNTTKPTKRLTRRRSKTIRKNFRLSDVCNDQLARGADALGITETAFIELAVREKFAATPNTQ